MAYTFKGDINDVPVYVDLGQASVLTYRTSGTIPANPDPATLIQPQFYHGIPLTSPDAPI